MKIALQMNKPEYFNDASEVIRLFYADCTIFLENGAECDCLFTQNADGDTHTVRLFKAGILQHQAVCSMPFPSRDKIVVKRYEKRGMKTALYQLLKEYTQKMLPWGSLTGIRPTRLVYEFLHSGVALPQACEQLLALYDVSAEKTHLLQRIIGRQQSVVRFGQPNEVDVYIGIPFCNGRCSYCSFPSLDIARAQDCVAPYIAALLGEISAVLPFVKDMTIRSIYIGGGTPGAIECVQLAPLLDFIGQNFPPAQEYTVEIGRPDAVTPQMLSLLKQYGVGRISINPQTMRNETLCRVGRNHDARSVVDAFILARKYGFSAINMDLIAGLPGETQADMEYTLAHVLPLRPQNITVHTLALKRASTLKAEKDDASLPQDEVVQQMVELAYQTITTAGYEPYYLYRQKYMAGNLENVGYTLPHAACIYNVDIMEETHHNLAFGAGAITKWLNHAQNRLERSPNVRNVEQYITRYNEMAQRKIAVIGRMQSM